MAKLFAVMFGREAGFSEITASLWI